MSKITCPKCGYILEEGIPCPRCMLLLAAEPTGTFDADSSGIDQNSGEPQAESEMPDIETVRKAFPQLEILELLGRGGMGCVFKARQPKLNRLVALKILSPNLETKPGFAARFAHEGELLARLNHPNIVTVYDSGESGGFYYLLLEIVDGVNLRQAMRAERFTPEQALTIISKICDALQYAHGKGVLHRDIKPENILLDTAWQIKIADFGIGKLRDDSHDDSHRAFGVSQEQEGNETTAFNVSLTQTGQVIGTLAYMAPEQLDDPQHVDHRVDIYSLGVVFYELLTGELPRGHFPVPSEKSPVSADIDNTVMKALHKEREKRQQSAEELKSEIASAKGTPLPKQRNPLKFVWTFFSFLLIGFVLSILFEDIVSLMNNRPSPFSVSIEQIERRVDGNECQFRVALQCTGNAPLQSRTLVLKHM